MAGESGIFAFYSSTAKMAVRAREWESEKTQAKISGTERDVNRQLTALPVRVGAVVWVIWVTRMVSSWQAESLVFVRYRRIGGGHGEPF